MHPCPPETNHSTEVTEVVIICLPLLCNVKVFTDILNHTDILEPQYVEPCQAAMLRLPFCPGVCQCIQYILIFARNATIYFDFDNIFCANKNGEVCQTSSFSISFHTHYMHYIPASKLSLWTSGLKILKPAPNFLDSNATTFAATKINQINQEYILCTFYSVAQGVAHVSVFLRSFPSESLAISHWSKFYKSHTAVPIALAVPFWTRTHFAFFAGALSQWVDCAYAWQGRQPQGPRAAWKPSIQLEARLRKGKKYDADWCSMYMIVYVYMGKKRESL